LTLLLLTGCVCALYCCLRTTVAIAGRSPESVDPSERAPAIFVGLGFLLAGTPTERQFQHNNISSLEPQVLISQKRRKRALSRVICASEICWARRGASPDSTEVLAVWAYLTVVYPLRPFGTSSESLSTVPRGISVNQENSPILRPCIPKPSSTGRRSAICKVLRDGRISSEVYQSAGSRLLHEDHWPSEPFRQTR
jgi:hypothetical protein